MKSEVRHIQTYVRQHEGSEQTTVELIDKYFTDMVTWPLEKDEWSKMDPQARQNFADELTKPKSTPTKRVAAIVKVAKKQTKVPAKTNGKKEQSGTVKRETVLNCQHVEADQVYSQDR